MRVVFELATITGGPAPVLETFLADAPKGTLAVPVAMTVCRGVAEQIAVNNIRALVEPQIQDAYDLYVMVNGEHASVTGTARDEWEAGMDDVIEAVLLPYERCVSADWFGRNVIDTRLHQAVEAGADSEVTRLAKGLAKDAWRVLIHDMDHDPDEGGTPVLSTAKILSAIGIVASDLQEVLADRPAPTPEDVQHAKERTMAQLADTLTKIHDYLAMTGSDPLSAVAHIENALDSDAGLAISGIKQLAGSLATMADVEPLQAYGKQLGDGAVDAIVDMLTEGPDNNWGLEEAANNDGADETDTEAAELAAMMGDAVPSAPILPSPPSFGPPPGIAAPRAHIAIPIPDKTITGAIPAAAFALIRQYVNAKDDDIASGIGVSRQTFINYGKKSTFVPSPDAKAFLLGKLAETRDACQRAMDLIG